jgi:CDP-diacylglycerol---glycerol-3-phosphate 3-phosphatidyltransferase
VLNVANSLTVARILLVPVVVAVLFVMPPNGSITAAAVFAAAAVTDGLDGYVARSRRSITRFGSVMDPIADKLLIAAASISLAGLGRLAGWVAVAIVAREFAVSVLRVGASHQGIAVPSSRLGKTKTVLQVIALCVLIAVSDPGALWVLVLVYAAVAITLISGADYLLNVLRRLISARQLAKRDSVY